jgi:hypothetical protein
MMWKRISLAFFLSIFLVTASLSQVFAGGAGEAITGTNGLIDTSKKVEKQKVQKAQKNVPVGCYTTPEVFGTCPSSYYALDYVPKETYGVLTPGDSTENAFLTTVAAAFDFIWGLYVFTVELAINVITWAYDLPIIKSLINATNNSIDVFNKWVWKPLWYMVMVFALLNILYLYKDGRYNKIMVNVINIAVIGGIAMALYHDMPTMASNTQDKFNDLGKYTLAGMLYYAPDTKTDVPTVGAAKPANEEITKNDAQGAGKKATGKVANALWRTMVYEPTLALNWGSVTAGEKYVREFYKWGTNDTDIRRKYLTGQLTSSDNGQSVGRVYIDPKEGKAQNADFRLMTESGLKERFIRLSTIIPSGLVLVALVFCLSIWMIWWGLKCIARIIWGGFRLLLALFPEYGWREVVDWVWSVLSAASMKFFISILLGLVLVLWTGLAAIDMKLLGDSFVAAFIGKVVIQVGISLALFFEFLVVLKRMQIPLLGSSAALSDTPEAGQVNGWFKQRVNMLTGGVGSMVKGLAKSGVRGATDGVKAYLGYDRALRPGILRQFAQYRKGQLAKSTAQKEFKKQGFNPNSLEAREAFINQMAKEGRKAEAVQMVRDLGQIQKDKPSVTTARIQSVLTREASTVYKQMKQVGLNPLKQSDQEAWLKLRPNDGRVMEEIKSFAKKPVYRRMIDPPPKDWSVVPPKAPEKNTPEYDIWQQEGYMFMRRRYDQIFKEAKKEMPKITPQQILKFMQEHDGISWSEYKKQAAKEPERKVIKRDR